MAIEPEKVDQIIEAHAETVDGLKSQADELKAELAMAKEAAEKVPALEKQIEDMKASDPTEEWKAKYAELNDKYEAEKLSLYRNLLREIGLDERRVEKASLLKDLDELTVEDGKLVGYDELREAEAEEWAAFIPQEKVQGAPVPTPPKAEPAGEQPHERAVRIAQERHEKMYGKSEE